MMLNQLHKRVVSGRSCVMLTQNSPYPEVDADEPYQ